MPLRFGVDRLIADQALRAPLKGRRVALLAHPASMTGAFDHSVDALAGLAEIKLSAAFGPQHGMRGDKQDNMIESDDYVDPVHEVPVFSLYGKVRRPTPDMLDTFDVILVDMQDVGCRVYTFLTTLLYLIEGCAKAGKSIWVLDRPNPAGRPVEGSALKPGWESFVGATPGIPMRHGLTLGELAQWFRATLKIDVDLNVVAMEGYDPARAPGFGWPLGDRAWVNPSPNATTLSMARCYAGTVLVEGTHLSEGRGTTRPLETVGAPDLRMREILARMRRLAPHWMEGCRVRPCGFEPTFNKHEGRLCAGMQLHVDDGAYDHARFRPYRLVGLWLKAIREEHAESTIWRDFEYEYESGRLAIDLINGGPGLREWVEDAAARPDDLERSLRGDEARWEESRAPFLIY